MILCFLLLLNLQKGALCADTVIGQGSTTSWKMCGLDSSTSLTVFFDISPSERSNQQGITNQQLYIQFTTRFCSTCSYAVFMHYVCCIWKSDSRILQLNFNLRLAIKMQRVTWDLGLQLSPENGWMARSTKRYGMIRTRVYDILLYLCFLFLLYAISLNTKI